MTITIQADGLNVDITAQPLTQYAFSPFGDVVSNPHPQLHPSSAQNARLPPNGQMANQGTAIQYRPVSRFHNLYHQAPSGSGKPTMSIFAVAERPLISSSTGHDTGEITVRIMERHPFTTQTFTPLASSPTTYLIIVAPSLPPSPKDKVLPVPQGDDLPGRGLPDVRRLRAFIASSGQAVTYGAGTWHAPMVALGREGGMQTFQVVQFMSGVGGEDTQLVEFVSGTSGEPDIRVRIVVPPSRLEKL